ncbi:MAG: efflux RND transporter periplasmic adaptor subunit [Planctomycetales bacterium]|nr:efflux RND transporter periplasmic adaptor subunit [Planctomycetales bacterium]
MSKTSRWPRAVGIAVATVCVVGVAVALAATRSAWEPTLRGYLALAASSDSSEADDARAVAEHDHASDDHAGHDEFSSVRLSDRALKNIGFAAFTVTPQDYTQQLTLPAIVVERPGRSQIHITAPLTGIVTKIMAVTGEAVGPGDALFEVRLTHEELVNAQREFLETIARLKVVDKEIERLHGLGDGVVPGKRVLEQEYEQQKLEVALMAARQAMLLHGLTDEQVEQVRDTGRLFRNITIRAPEHNDADETCAAPHLFTVQRLDVAQGEHVQMGRELAVLADHCELQIEALAFEDDAADIRRAAQAGRRVTAEPFDADTDDAQLRNLAVLYVAGQIDPESRAFKVYVQLPNEIALDRTTSAGTRFLEWAYKPGQRMQLHIPVETWQDQVVLPNAAVVDDGAEAYVYRQDGDHFDRVPVRVLFRDSRSAVVENDGALYPGDVIAGRGAYQMHLALKNKSGGAIDPHAGHHH